MAPGLPDPSGLPLAAPWQLPLEDPLVVSWPTRYNPARGGDNLTYKTDLVKKVARETRVSRKLTTLVLNELVKTIQDTLGQHQTVRIPGFGVFYVRQRRAGKARNFKTGQPQVIPAMTLPAFRAGELLKRRVRRDQPVPRKKATRQKKK